MFMIPRKISGFKYSRRPTAQWTLGCYNYDVSWQYWVFWKSCTLCNIIHNIFCSSPTVHLFVHLSICQEFFQDIIIFWSFWIWKDFFFIFLFDLLGFGIFCCILKQHFFLGKFSVFTTNQLKFSTNLVIFMTNQVIFRTYPVIFRTNPVTFRTVK